MISMVKPLGMDVSHWKGVVDWGKAKGAGISFGFAKASEGTGWEDATYERNYLDAKAAGVPLGAFHWYLPWQDPLVQAEWFLKCAPESGGMPWVVDVEDKRSIPKGYAGKLETFCDWVTIRTGEAVIIYTGAAYWTSYVGDVDWAGQYGLWIANYKRVAGPAVPAPWHPEGWLIWQYTDKGKGSRYGVQFGTVDLNVGNWVGN